MAVHSVSSEHTNRMGLTNKGGEAAISGNINPIRYRAWIKSLPFYNKWFVLLVLTRPFIDMLYFMKETSPLLSPLYWVGILTPILTLYSLQATREKNLEIQRVFPGLKLLMYLTLASIFVGTLNTGNLIAYMGLMFKIITPLVLGYFIGRIILLEGFKEKLLYTLSLAALFASILMVLEYFVNPGSRSMGSTGNEYVEGFFADPFSYGMYLNILLVTGLRESYTKKYRRWVFCVLLAGSVVLLTIGHLSSIALLGVLSLYKYMYKIGRGGALPYIIIIAAALYFMQNEIAEDSVSGQQLSNEMEVIVGTRPVEQAAHGRMSRWIMYMDAWSDQTSFSKIFGIPYTFERGIEQWISGSVHNDFLRMMFTVGIFGLAVYIFIIMRLFLSKRGDPEYMLEFKSMMLVVVVYSFTALPLLVPMTSYLFAISLGMFAKR